MSMEFGFGASVTRQRRRDAIDPYSQKNAPGDWTNPAEEPITGAFVASTSRSASTDANRSSKTTQKSLYCSPEDDVLAGDRIVAAGVTYEVPTKPSADMNPFTGWQPVLEIPLSEVTG